MAITPTNSNTVSIVNLPQSQLAVGSDLLVLQTTNGTQTIKFDNFNVVKTDVSGNATVTGTLSGGTVNFNSLQVNTLTASSITTPAGPAVTLPTGFYNQFTIQNGLILSAVSNITSDPVYNQLYNNDIPSFVQGILKGYGVTPYVERYGAVVIPAGATTYQVNLDSFFSTPPTSYIAASNITPAHIYLTTDFVPNTGSSTVTTISPSSLTALQSLSAIAFLSGGFNGGTPSSSINYLNTLSGTDAYNLFVNGFQGSTVIPNFVIPIIQPGSISTMTSSDGSSTGLTFTVTIGNPQSVGVTVYWKLSIAIPLTTTT